MFEIDNDSLLPKAQKGDKAAFSELVNGNMGLVKSIALRFRERGVDFEDLVQIGTIGLIKAIRNFDTSVGTRFSTYAVPVIMGEIRRLFRDGGAIKVGRTLKERSVRVMRESEAFRREMQREPTVSELAARMQLDPTEVAEALNAAVPPVSLTVGDEDGESQLDIPVDSHEERVAELLTLRQVIGELAPRDRSLVILRFFQNRTQTQTAAQLGMTQVQVSRREKVILREMRQKMTG